MDGAVEIITGQERRRRWSTEDKLRIVAETREPGAQIKAVAARNGICESLVYTWRRQEREGVLAPTETPMFVPVRALEAAIPTSTPPADLDRRIESQPGALHRADHAGTIEIDLGDGRRIRVGDDVNVTALRRVLQALQP